MLPVSVIVGLSLAILVASLNIVYAIEKESPIFIAINGFTFGTILAIFVMNSPK